jgi:hypothetical protein
MSCAPTETRSARAQLGVGIAALAGLYLVVFGPALVNALRAVAGSAATAAPVGWSSRAAAVEGYVFAVVVVLATVLRWLPKLAPDIIGELGLGRRVRPGALVGAAAAYVGIAVVSGWLGDRLVAGLHLPHAGYPAAGRATGGFLLDTGASVAAGLTEEITLLALAVAVLELGWRVRGQRPAWATPATIGLLLLLRWPLHLYYLWGSLFVLFWVPAAYALYRWIGSVWPLVLGHAAYDCLLSAGHAYPELTTLVDRLLWLIAILGAGAIAVDAAARRRAGPLDHLLPSDGRFRRGEPSSSRENLIISSSDDRIPVLPLKGRGRGR